MIDFPIAELRDDLFNLSLVIVDLKSAFTHFSHFNIVIKNAISHKLIIRLLSTNLCFEKYCRFNVSIVFMYSPTNFFPFFAFYYRFLKNKFLNYIVRISTFTRFSISRHISMRANTHRMRSIKKTKNFTATILNATWIRS